MAGKSNGSKQPQVEWLTTKEAAEHSGLSRGRVVQLANTHKLTARHDFLPGTSIKAVFVDKASLDAYTANSNGRSRSPKGSKAFVITVAADLQAEIEKLLSERGIAMKPRYTKATHAPEQAGDTDTPVEETELDDAASESEDE